MDTDAKIGDLMSMPMKGWNKHQRGERRAVVYFYAGMRANLWFYKTLVDAQQRGTELMYEQGMRRVVVLDLLSGDSWEWRCAPAEEHKGEKK